MCVLWLRLLRSLFQLNVEHLGICIDCEVWTKTVIVSAKPGIMVGGGSAPVPDLKGFLAWQSEQVGPGRLYVMEGGGGRSLNVQLKVR